MPLNGGTLAAQSKEGSTTDRAVSRRLWVILTRVVVQTLEVDPIRARSRSQLSGKNRIPNLRCGFVFDAKLAEFELTLSNPVHEFDAGYRRYGSTKMFEAEHRTKPQLDRTVILFNQIVDVFGRPDLALISLRMFVQSLLGRAM
jgi:hypothetical protein